MIRYYAGMALQLLGLVLTGESLLFHFGDHDARPMVKLAALGAGLFYAGWLVRPRNG
jgi:hypothetical protein